jgi:hypothetical protein
MLASEDERGGPANAACGSGDNDGLSSEIIWCLGHALFLRLMVLS